MDTLLKLKALDLSKADPDIIRRLMGDAKLSAIEFEISVDTLIVRGRKGGFFTDQKDMTYCPVQYWKMPEPFAPLNAQNYVIRA